MSKGWDSRSPLHRTLAAWPPLACHHWNRWSISRTTSQGQHHLGWTVCQHLSSPRPRVIMEPRGRLPLSIQWYHATGIYSKVNFAVLTCLMKSVTLLELANASAGWSSRLILRSRNQRVFTSKCFTLPAPFRMRMPFLAFASRHKERTLLVWVQFRHRCSPSSHTSQGSVDFCYT